MANSRRMDGLNRYTVMVMYLCAKTMQNSDAIQQQVGNGCANDSVPVSVASVPTSIWEKCSCETIDRSTCVVSYVRNSLPLFLSLGSFESIIIADV
eukprot:6073133-Amphidinium_carterae.3